MSSPFLILGLPRSRTAWLSRFLSYPPWSCGHEDARHLRSMADVRSWLSQPYTGSAETALARWWPLIPKIAPTLRIVVVRRPVPEVVDSLMRLRLGFDRDLLSRVILKLDHALDMVEDHVPCLRVGFAELAEEGCCRRVFEHCLNLPHDHNWWLRWEWQNVQCNMGAILRYAEAFKPQMTLAGRLALAELKEACRPNPLPRVLATTDDGVDLVEDDFTRFRRDAEPLFRLHCLAVGEREDQWREKNWPLFETLDAQRRGCIITARREDRMLGYLVSILAPSTEHQNRLIATETVFFVDPAAPPLLALKMQRVAIEAMKRRGVAEIYLRAGIRGSGERLGSLYRRLGAEPFGTLYKLSIENATQQDTR